MTEAKVKLYKTAKALIGCAHFKQGDFVSVEYYGKDDSGTHWFNTSKNSVKPLFADTSAVYPEHHLSDFCL